VTMEAALVSGCYRLFSSTGEAEKEVGLTTSLV
jgi:hypothetical protein